MLFPVIEIINNSTKVIEHLQKEKFFSLVIVHRPLYYRVLLLCIALCIIMLYIFQI